MNYQINMLKETLWLDKQLAKCYVNASQVLLTVIYL